MIKNKWIVEEFMCLLHSEGPGAGGCGGEGPRPALRLLFSAPRPSSGAEGGAYCYNHASFLIFVIYYIYYRYYIYNFIIYLYIIHYILCLFVCLFVCLLLFLIDKAALADGAALHFAEAFRDDAQLVRDAVLQGTLHQREAQAQKL